MINSEFFWDTPDILSLIHYAIKGNHYQFQTLWRAAHELQQYLHGSGIYEDENSNSTDVDSY